MAILISSILAGIMIGIGGSVFVAMRTVNIVAGALIFAIGLFSILVFRLHLYTGKICYVWTGKEPSYVRVANVLLVLLGNTVGAALAGFALSEKMLANAAPIVAAKLAQPLWLALVLGIFCGILIYVAVEGFRRVADGALRATLVFLSVGGFILAGFEHSIADIFYFAAARQVSLDAFLFLMAVVLGNSIGGIAFSVLHTLYDRLTARAAEREQAAQEQAAQEQAAQEQVEEGAAR